MNAPRSASIVIATSSLALILALPGCGTDSGCLLCGDIPKVVYVTVVPDSISLSVGDTASFEAVAKYDNGNSHPAYLADWESSHPAVATVSPSRGARAVVTGIGHGRARISATHEDKTGWAIVNVN